MMYNALEMDRSTTAALICAFKSCLFIYIYIFVCVPVNMYMKLKRLWLGQKPIPCPKTSQ